jgi:hypothetical protein
MASKRDAYALSNEWQPSFLHVLRAKQVTVIGMCLSYLEDCRSAISEAHFSPVPQARNESGEAQCTVKAANDIEGLSTTSIR